MQDIPSLEDFRMQAAAFISDAVNSKDACPAYGAILPPLLHEQAMHWQRFCF